MRRITLTDDEHNLMLTMIGSVIDTTIKDMGARPNDPEVGAVYLRAKNIQRKLLMTEQLD